MKLQIKRGTTSRSILVFLQDSTSTTGAGKTGLLWNSVNLQAYYARPGEVAVAIPLATQTVTGAYSSGGFKEVDATNMPGIYRFDIPDAALNDTGSRASVVITIMEITSNALNLVPGNIEIQLGGADFESTFGVTAATETQIDNIETKVNAFESELDSIDADVNDLANVAIAEISDITDVPATPTLKQAVMLLYMWLRNNTQSTATERRIFNDAGTEILDATISDAGGTTSQGKLTDP